MKNIILMLCLFIFFAEADAQIRPAKKAVKTERKPIKPAKDQIVNQPIDLKSTVSYNALSPVYTTTNFSIADATVIRLHNNSVSPSGAANEHRPILGVSRKNFGIAHGKLLLQSTTGVSSGGNTGTGHVGTGSSVVGLGISGASMQVNGKSPFSPTGMYGATVGEDLRPFFPARK